MASALASSRCVSSVAGLAVAAKPAAMTGPRVVAPRAALPSFKKIAQTAGVSVATLAVAFSANAANIKMGGDGGELAFIPSSVNVSAGETITFTNNAGFPHNIVFDEDAVPAGVDAGALSHDDLVNAKGDVVTITLTKAGEYEYYCEPHQGAGMTGKITVS
ncbi:plastocyanin [Klebsormidium nitens]|uniref:Plastocyanin n=1 Tax=Klebsormidium nitens TaxID=105231 RepID=A0A1Y1HZG2_KLENI|nr:plastocyanin [Klebsormidium nitens]|eukprot:GAQ83122.1 plastocyanin [Klebsormidium nitens]